MKQGISQAVVTGGRDRLQVIHTVDANCARGKEGRQGRDGHPPKDLFYRNPESYNQRLQPNGLGFKAHGRSKDRLQHKLTRSLIKT